MALGSLYKLDTVVLPGPVQLSRLSNVRMSPEIEDLVTRPAGHTMPMFAANARYRPIISFTTGQIDLACGTIPVQGLALGSATYLYFKLAAATGNAARNSTVHRRYIINLGLAYYTSVRLPHKGEGTVDIVLAADFDGTNNPIVSAGTVALPTGQIAGDHFGAGPLYINGTQLHGIQDVTINSGCQIFTEGGESEEFDTFVALMTADPTVEATYFGGALTDIGMVGTTLNGSTGIVAYGRKFSPGAGMLANATAEHCLFTGLNGKVKAVEDTGDGSQLNRGRIMATLTAADDTVVPITFSDGQTIP